MATHLIYTVELLVLAALPWAHGLLGPDVTSAGVTSATVDKAFKKGLFKNSPEVDQWHAMERRRIAAECDEMMRELDEEKRRKLDKIVDQRAAELDEELKNLAAARAKAKQEINDLQKEEAEASEEARRVPPTKDAVDDATAIRAKWLAKVRELQALIAEKEACVDELRKAEEELLEAKRQLAEAKARLAEMEKKAKEQKENAAEEEDHVNREKDHVDSAEDAYDRAKARWQAAKDALAKAERDLKEHDEDTSPSNTYSGPSQSFLLNSRMPVGAKSGAAPVAAAGAGTGMALLVVAFLH